MRKFLVVIAALFGMLIAYIDSRPNWDDTGITVGLLILSTGVLGFLSPKRPWIWALAVGMWIPLVSIFVTHSYGGLIAIVFAFAGAYGGMLIRKAISMDTKGKIP